MAAEVLGREVTIVDSATAVARQVGELLQAWDRAAPTGRPAHHRFCVTDAPDRVGAVAARFWGDGEPMAFEHVDLIDHGSAVG